MKFTGEQLIPELMSKKTSPHWEVSIAEHMERYGMASKYVPGKKVLDIASGSGYGTEFLRVHNTEEVVGVDISKEAVDYAQNRYPLCKFIAEDAINYVNTDYFDVITSFETIEHVKEPQKLVDNIYKSLKIGGYFLASAPVFKHKNPYHLTEFTAESFHAMVGSKFKIEQEVMQECKSLILICKKI